MSKRKPKKYGMTNWYSPVVLIKTAIRVMVSTVFGEFADRREAMAASNAIKPEPFDSGFDYSASHGDFWFDYLADTGDGWNSTYAMARLASQDSISAGNAGELPRGKFLVLGGDQVYPFATREDYDDKFLAPFDAAYRPSGEPKWPERAHDLYALPGNHDWYDGLSSFFGLFCRRRIKPENAIGFDRKGREIAGRDTRQTRSYFAAKLPGKWWIWGTDAQLEGYIDQPQIDFFVQAATTWMEPGSNLILCVDGPRWVYADPEKPETKFENFSYLERLAGSATKDGKSMGHKLKLVLTGDSHHYSRYTEGDRQYVTCGGGGAFLHPTHHLKQRNSFPWDYPPPGKEYDPKEKGNFTRTFTLAKKADGNEALFPSRRDSRTLAWKNLQFAFINRSFTVTLLVAYGLFDWLLDFNARLSGRTSIGHALREGGFWHSIGAYWSLVFVSPAAIMLILVGLAGYIYAAEIRDSEGLWTRVRIGASHAALQAAVVTFTTCAVIHFLWPISAVVDIPVAALAAALLSATTYGLYLLVMLNLFRRHWNEAFSSFAYGGFKNMLRMKVSPDGKLTLYPIGLEKVPQDMQDPPRDPELRPALIEEPITLS